jgi:hypothetical protein
LLAINSTITSDGSVHATVRAFTGVMYLEDLLPHTPFSTVEFPETSSDALQSVNVSQAVNLSNSPLFTTFNTWLLNNETLRVTITGDTAIRVRGIARDYPVTFRKTITLNGEWTMHPRKMSPASKLPDTNVRTKYRTARLRGPQGHRRFRHHRP